MISIEQFRRSVEMIVCWSQTPTFGIDIDDFWFDLQKPFALHAQWLATSPSFVPLCASSWTRINQCANSHNICSQPWMWSICCKRGCHQDARGEDSNSSMAELERFREWKSLCNFEGNSGWWSPELVKVKSLWWHAETVAPFPCGFRHDKETMNWIANRNCSECLRIHGK
jgi:hypothetical protein